MIQSHVTIPWGDWLVLVLNQIAPIVIALILAGVTWLCRHLPGTYGAAVKEYVTQAKIGRAVDYAFAKIEGAEKGKTLSVDKVDPLTAMAAQYGLTMFPQLVKQLGERFEPMILAKISQSASISGAATTAAPLPAAPVTTSFNHVPA